MGFFRNDNAQFKAKDKGFLEYKFNGLSLRPAFIFNDSFKINKNYHDNFLYHNLFSYFRDYFS